MHFVRRNIDAISFRSLQHSSVCAIKAPGFGENRRANLDDLAILTGGEFITEDRGLTLDKVQFEMLGTAKKKLIEERCADKCT
ncbi:hypothetical protein CMV_017147 [Castanea mollissima]|uniref:Uncharacterized protein n=1 Tax=Castanea mollissima TaxID=60419 RepID=A0A8J4R6P8_9ROSI|nr:hypothetical protein CMV_017147 [Castanea mollissima]